ncbi:hypothetical protein BC831DRAFT_258142 [Entophlyctis helioformis]|nr:hypothetical protein BC831DRAFT_258142 [Entophlyctis helioformis]
MPAGVFNKALLAVSVVGVVLNSALIASIMGSKALRAQPETILNASLACIDMLFALSIASKQAMILAVDGRENTFLHSSFGCNVDAGVLKGLAVASILTLASISVYHYLRVVPERKHPPTARTLVIWSASMWVFSGIWSFMPIAFGTGYVLQPSKLFCSIDYPSHSLAVMIETSLDLLLFAGCFGVIAACYGCIFAKFMGISNRVNAVTARANHQMDSSDHSSQTQTGNHSQSTGSLRPLTKLSEPPLLGRSPQLSRAAHKAGVNGQATKTAASGDYILGNSHKSLPQNGDSSSSLPKEPKPAPSQAKYTRPRSTSNPVMMQMKMAIIRRAIIITGSFAVCWLPFLVCTLYQTFTRTFVSELFDSLVILVGGCAVVLNPIAFFIVDVQYRRGLFDMIGWTERHAKSTDKDAIQVMMLIRTRPLAVNIENG